MNKFYYERRMCKALGYLSLNPVLYESTEEKGVYKKVCMKCNAINAGVCTISESCSLLFSAPELVVDNGVNLRNKKIGE